MARLRKHSLLPVIVGLYLALAGLYASLVPLGEAPDEPAHLTYARFIVERGRLPSTLEERAEAGYRSAWPPLYHLLLAPPLALVGDAPPTRLKSVGDTPRRLIPTNGQTIASFIHTADEAWPWRGVSLAWHLGRFVSALLAALAVGVTYAIAWRLTRRRLLAAGAAALQAFLPQFLFIGSVLNDDNLLILLSGLVFLLLVEGSQTKEIPRPGYFLLLGLLLGLAMTAKYNALPLWAAAIIWTIRRFWPVVHRSFLLLLARLGALLAGAVLSGGWWFVFIWRHFNQIEQQGPVAGALAALSAGSSDAALRQLSSGPGLAGIPPMAAWLEWMGRFFRTFWGSFGGGGVIEFPGWVYWVLALFCLLAVGALMAHFLLEPALLRPEPGQAYAVRAAPRKRQRPGLVFFLLSPLLFLPLPLARFLLSGSVFESAQGRHLFPALPLLSLALVLGLSYLARFIARRLPDAAGALPAPSFTRNRYGFCLPATSLRAGSFFAPYTLRGSLLWPLVLPLLGFGLSLYGLALIRDSYPPRIPLTTLPDRLTVEQPVQARLADSVTLSGYEVGPPEDHILPVSLLWQAEAIPPEDYLIELSLTGPDGQPLGGWLGQPIGGRYPTRAWDEGDILRDTIPALLIPGLSTGETTATLALILHDANGEPTAQPLVLDPALHLPTSPSPHLPIPPSRLRADGLPAQAPFSYRSTISAILSGQAGPPVLVAPDGQRFEPASLRAGPGGSLAHFMVAADWPGGSYQLIINNEELVIMNDLAPIFVANRARQFETPAVEHWVGANFGDQVTLLGYDLPRRRVEPGESFPLTLHLRAERTMGHDLVIFNHLLDREAIQRGGGDRIPKNFYTTLLWVPGEIVSDAYEAPVEPGAPPGVYWLDVGLYPARQPTFSLPLFVDGRPIDRNSVRIGPLKVGGPPPGLTVTEVQPRQPRDISFGGQITLLGFDLIGPAGHPLKAIENPKSKIQNPDSFTLYWQPAANPTADYTVFVHILDAAGKLAAQADGPPAAGAYPTSLWEPGEIIVDERPLPALPPGRYTLHLGLYQVETGVRLAAPGSRDGAVELFAFEVGP